MEDSIDYKRRRKTPIKATPKLPTTETIEVGGCSTRNSGNSVTFKKGLLKSSSKEKSQFRIKQISGSPVKVRQASPISSGSITLYGQKFRQSIGGAYSGDTPELITFYGKMGEGRSLKKRGKIEHKPAATFRKKNRL